MVHLSRARLGSQFIDAPLGSAVLKDSTVESPPPLMRPSPPWAATVTRWVRSYKDSHAAGAATVTRNTPPCAAAITAAHAQTHLSADVANAELCGPDPVVCVWCPDLPSRHAVTQAVTLTALLWHRRCPPQVADEGCR